MKFPRIFYSKLFLTGILVVLAGAFALQLKQWQERQSVNREIAKLKSQQQQLEQKNKDLAQSLQYFSTDTYKEKLAREQLGLKKDGEIVVNFPSNLNTTSANTEPPKMSNPQKWWQYIFLKNHN